MTPTQSHLVPTKGTPEGGGGRELLRLAECARLLGVSRSTAYRWADLGRLPIVRRSGGLYVPRAALTAYLAAEAEAALESLRDG